MNNYKKTLELDVYDSDVKVGENTSTYMYVCLG